MLRIPRSFLLLATAAALTAAPARADDDEDCRVLEGNLRIDSAAQLAGYEDICEITGPLAIFPDDAVEITFPKLRKAPFINIESDSLKAINFPLLKEVRSLYVKGPRLELVELPSLVRTSDIFYFKTRRVRFLHLPNLVQVGKLNVQGNFELEFIAADNLYDIRELFLENNPRLAQGTKEYLGIATRVLTQHEQDIIRQGEEDIREFKRRLLEQQAAQPPMPPTGHDVQFGSIGFYQYYQYSFWNYWATLGRWGYDRHYRYVIWL